jgi:hypothetical protein
MLKDKKKRKTNQPAPEKEGSQKIVLSTTTSTRHNTQKQKIWDMLECNQDKSEMLIQIKLVSPYHPLFDSLY